jgi:hypothetical protein
MIVHIPSVLTGAVPIPVKDHMQESKNDKHDVQIESETNLLDILPNNIADAPCTVNTGFGTTKDGQKSNCEVEESPAPELNTETSSHDEPLSHERAEYVMPSRNKIYAVDVRGCCRPVNNYTFVGNSKMHVFKQHENQTPSSDIAETSSPNQPQDTFGAAVHILPEKLVNGAINAASQAYTTARAVLSSLRSRPSEVSIYIVPADCGM